VKKPAWEFCHSGTDEKKRQPADWEKQNKTQIYLLNIFEGDNRPVVPEKIAYLSMSFYDLCNNQDKPDKKAWVMIIKDK
jgi:hypothetical protein